MIRTIPLGAGSAICARWQMRTTTTVNSLVAAKMASGNQTSNRRHHGVGRRTDAEEAGSGSGAAARSAVRTLDRSHLGSVGRWVDPSGYAGGRRQG